MATAPCITVGKAKDLNPRGGAGSRRVKHPRYALLTRAAANYGGSLPKSTSPLIALSVLSATSDPLHVISIRFSEAEDTAYISLNFPLIWKDSTRAESVYILNKHSDAWSALPVTFICASATHPDRHCPTSKITPPNGFIRDHPSCTPRIPARFSLARAQQSFDPHYTARPE